MKKQIPCEKHETCENFQKGSSCSECRNEINNRLTFTVCKDLYKAKGGKK